MLTYIKGDLFDFLSINDLVVHVCNDVGGFGSGFAGALARKYPEVRESFMSWVKLGVWKTITMQPNQPAEEHFYELGDVQILPVCGDEKIKGFYVANMVAQRGLISQANPHPIRYDALREAMTKITQSFTINYVIRIIAPKFGAGLAGGDWNIIEGIINDVWKDLDVVIVEYNNTKTY
jgi:O-acetyl-ADP-ribose deacetylase (regulator of RNase III)